MKRRDLLRASAALPFAAAWNLPAIHAAQSSGLPIIDTHQHLWDLKLFQPPWLKGAPEVLTATHVTEHYLKETEGLGIESAVYMEIDVHPDDQRREAEHVIGLCRDKSHPTSAAIISGRPNQATFASYLKPFAETGYVKGVRQVLHPPSTKRGLCLEKQFVQSMRHLGEIGLTFDLCMRPTELVDGVRLAQKCKDTQFVVDHCGNADPKAFLPKAQQTEEPWHGVDVWKRQMAAFAKEDNVACKISGIIARAPKDCKPEHLAPAVNFCLDAFGPDRVVFGGDWPVCKLGGSLRQWVEYLKVIVKDRPRSEQRKLFRDNAVRIYKLA